MDELIKRLEEARLLVDRRPVTATRDPLTLRHLDPGAHLLGRLQTVDELWPDASTTRACPPRPSASAIAPVTIRRCFSSRWGSTVSKNARSPPLDSSTQRRVLLAR